ncbi:MAG: UDP-2,3-diacylglucosamine diphosphatase LpxI [Candidatus Dependentiae bacterium]|jgi:DUF1009 family protein
MKSQTAPKRLALIAGTGTLPLDAIAALRAQKKDFFVLSLFPEENGAKLRDALQEPAVELIAEPFYKLGAIKKVLRDKCTTDVVMLGKVDKRNLLSRLSYDWELIKIAATVMYRGDAAVMEHIVRMFEKEGITVQPQTTLLSSLFVAPGVLCGTISEAQQRDITYGLDMASKLSTLDVGQTVVVKEGMVIAVEAIEGTDECIARGITLAKKGAVIAKTCQPQQNSKFDIPTLGPATLENIPAGSISVIAWHADRTFIAQRELFVKMAKERGIALVAVASDN